jgi:hypothetical protein
LAIPLHRIHDPLLPRDLGTVGFKATFNLWQQVFCWSG